MERGKGWQVTKWAITKDFGINLQSRKNIACCAFLPVVVILHVGYYSTFLTRKYVSYFHRQSHIAANVHILKQVLCHGSLSLGCKEVISTKYFFHIFAACKSLVFCCNQMVFIPCVKTFWTYKTLYSC